MCWLASLLTSHGIMCVSINVMVMQLFPQHLHDVVVEDVDMFKVTQVVNYP